VLHSAQHAGRMHGLAHRHPSFPRTVRLAKLWIHSHMFSGYLDDEVIELMVASLYTNSRPYEEPHNHLVGFLRFLHLLQNHNWEDEALVVDIDGEFDQDDYQQIHATYERLRGLQRTAKERGNKLKETALFISTPADKYSRLTRHAPSPLIFKRMVGYAKQSYAILRNLVANPFVPKSKWKALFLTPLQPFNVLIHLDPSVVSSQGQDGKQKNKKRKKNRPTVYVGLNVVEAYLSELREQYSHLALFFHNAVGGCVIGVVWKPGTFVPKPFKVQHAQYATPLALLDTSSSLVQKLKIKATDAAPSKQAQVVTNIFELLDDFTLLGKGLVQRVQPNV